MRRPTVADVLEAVTYVAGVDPLTEGRRREIIHSMRTLTVHTADELVERWRIRALRWRFAWGDVSTADAVEACADELEAVLRVAMEAEGDAATALLDWSQGNRP